MHSSITLNHQYKATFSSFSTPVTFVICLGKLSDAEFDLSNYKAHEQGSRGWTGAQQEDQELIRQ